MKNIWLVSAAFFAVPSALQAQQAPVPATAAVADANEIIVTATRRSQALSDVPVAVSAVSAAQLQNSGGTDIRQLNQLAPSLLVSSATNESNGAARIRGIGTVGENPGLESSVAVFIDGVYRSRTGVGLTDLGPLESIEVLRGPQGTLFGRNASAGLINITTAKPKFEPGGQAEASYGNFNAIRLMGGVTGPISENIAFRVDGLYNKRDGFLTDVISGRRLNNRDRFLVRGQLLLNPTDDLSIRLIGDYNQKNEECCGASTISPIVGLARDAGGNVITTPNGVANLVTALGGVYRQAPTGKRYIYETSVTPGQTYNQRTRDYGGSAEINWDLGSINLTSITGYREFKNKSAQDSDFNSIDILHRTDNNRKFQTFTQEVRLQGEAFGDRLDYLIGGFYSHEVLRTDDDLVYGNNYEAFVNGLVGAAGTSVAAEAAKVGYVPPAGQGLINNTGIVQGGFFKQTSNNYAFFTHNVFAVVEDKVFLTVGARYTNDTKDLESVFLTNNNLCGALRRAPAAAPGLAAAQRGAVQGAVCSINNTPGAGFKAGDPGAQRKEDEFTYTAVLSWKPIDELLGYGSYSRGYKGGGYNLDTAGLIAGAPSAAQLQFEPEIVDAFEVGAKLDLRAFKLNFAAFYQKFNNFQLNTFNGLNFEVANISGCAEDLGGRDRDLIFNNSACAGKARAGVISKGLEFEGAFYPSDDLAITQGLTISRTSYANQLTGLGGVSLPPALFQLPGARLSNASDYVATGSLAWSPKINDTFSALFYVDYRLTSELNTGSDLDFEKRQPAFVTANARIGLYGPDRRWGIEFWGQNIFNTVYEQVAADAPGQGSGTFNAVARGLSATASQVYLTFPAEPRTYGVTVRTKF